MGAIVQLLSQVCANHTLAGGCLFGIHVIPDAMPRPSAQADMGAAFCTKVYVATLACGGSVYNFGLDYNGHTQRIPNPWRWKYSLY